MDWFFGEKGYLACGCYFQPGTLPRGCALTIIGRDILFCVYSDKPPGRQPGLLVLLSFDPIKTGMPGNKFHPGSRLPVG